MLVFFKIHISFSHLTFPWNYYRVSELLKRKRLRGSCQLSTNWQEETTFLNNQQRLSSILRSYVKPLRSVLKSYIPLYASLTNFTTVACGLFDRTGSSSHNENFKEQIYCMATCYEGYVADQFRVRNLCGLIYSTELLVCVRMFQTMDRISIINDKSSYTSWCNVRNFKARITFG